jgi:hypothetical protein
MRRGRGAEPNPGRKPGVLQGGVAGIRGHRDPGAPLPIRRDRRAAAPPVDPPYLQSAPTRGIIGLFQG